MKNLLAIIVLAFASACCCAQSANLTDFSQPILTVEGKPFMGTADDGKSPRPLTLRDVAITALQTPLEEDKQGSKTKSVQILMLGLKIAEGKKLALTGDEIILLCDRITKAYQNQVLIGRAVLMIDPAMTPKQ